MGTKALISQEETHLISLLRIAATLGVLLIHVNQRLLSRACWGRLPDMEPTG